MEEQRGPVLGVGAVTIRDNAVLLIKRGAPPGRGQWSLPGGRVQWGESLAGALVREMREETGLEVEVGEQAGLFERFHPQEGFHYVIVDYFVDVVGGELRAGEDAAEARWVPVAAVEDLPLVPGLAEALRDFGVI